MSSNCGKASWCWEEHGVTEDAVQCEGWSATFAARESELLLAASADAAARHRAMQTTDRSAGAPASTAQPAVATKCAAATAPRQSDSEPRSQVPTAAAVAVSAPALKNASRARAANVAAIVRAHEKLGHISFDHLVSLIRGGAVLNAAKLDVTVDEINEARSRIADCAACAATKSSRTPFSQRGMALGRHAGEVLLVDARTASFTRQGRDVVEYSVTVTDSYSGWRWFARLANREEAASRLLAVLRAAQATLRRRALRVYADGGVDLVNAIVKRFCAQQGTHFLCPPSRDALNGVVVRSTRDQTRVLMCAADMPKHLWFYAAAHATFLWNRVHVARTGFTPYEFAFGTKPDARRWGVFGCDALYRGPHELDVMRDEACVYLGHNHDRDVAMVFAPRLNEVIFTSEVKYRATSFAFAKELKSSSLATATSRISAAGRVAKYEFSATVDDVFDADLEDDSAAEDAVMSSSVDALVDDESPAESASALVTPSAATAVAHVPVPQSESRLLRSSNRLRGIPAGPEMILAVAGPSPVSPRRSCPSAPVVLPAVAKPVSHRAYSVRVVTSSVKSTALSSSRRARRVSSSCVEPLLARGVQRSPRNQAVASGVLWTAFDPGELRVQADKVAFAAWRRRPSTPQEPPEAKPAGDRNF